MHFVICVFIALCLFMIQLLFTEMLPKFIKLISMILGSISGGYAIAILIRKAGTYFKWYKAPKLMPTFEIAAAILFVIVLAISIILAKKRQKNA